MIAARMCPEGNASVGTACWRAPLLTWKPMGLSAELYLVALIALVLLAIAAGRPRTAKRAPTTARPLLLGLSGRNNWAGDRDRLELLILAFRARSRFSPGIRIALRKSREPDLVLTRTIDGRLRLKLTERGLRAVNRPELLPAVDQVLRENGSGYVRLAAMLLLHRQARGGDEPSLSAVRSLKSRIIVPQGDIDRYLASRLDALEAAKAADPASGRQALRKAADRLATMRGQPHIDGPRLALNCGSLALDLARSGERAGLTRALDMLDGEAASLATDDVIGPDVELMRGRILAMQAEAFEDASTRQAALGAFNAACARAPQASAVAFEAGLAYVDCLLTSVEQPGARGAHAEALTLIASLAADAPVSGREARTRLALAKGRALYLAGIARGDAGLVEQSLAALPEHRAGRPSADLEAELAHWRGRARMELALRREDPQQARLAMAEFDAARTNASPCRAARLDLDLARVHGWLYETTRAEPHYLAAARAYRQALSTTAPGILSAAERHRGALGAARLHLAADDTTPRPETTNEAVDAWEAARASLPPGADALAVAELQRVGAMALRKLSRLKEGAARVDVLGRAVAATEAALDRLTEATMTGNLRVGLLRMRGEMLAELATLGAGPAALEKSISSYRHALEEAEGLARAEALEGLAQVLTDLAAAHGKAPPAAAHDALEEAYGLLVANGSPLRADLVLSNSRRLGPRPANDPH